MIKDEPVYWRRFGSTYPVSNLHRRVPIDRERALRIGTSYASDFQQGASEIWQDHRGSILVRLVDRWELRRFRGGGANRVDSWTLPDSRRARLRPPTAWANRVLSGRI